MAAMRHAAVRDVRDAAAVMSVAVVSRSLRDRNARHVAVEIQVARRAAIQLQAFPHRVIGGFGLGIDRLQLRFRGTGADLTGKDAVPDKKK